MKQLLKHITLSLSIIIGTSCACFVIGKEFIEIIRYNDAYPLNPLKKEITPNRYRIIKPDDRTFLLDTSTGETWRYSWSQSGSEKIWAWEPVGFFNGKDEKGEIKLEFTPF